MNTRRLTSPFESLLALLRSSEMATGLALSVAVGLVAGLGAVAFRWMIKGFQWLFFAQGATVLAFLGDYYVVLLPALGGLIFGPLIYFLAHEAKGHGVPEVMEAVAIRGGRIRARVAAIKALASSICIGSGGSVGREGPIVQIGSSFGSTIGQWLRLPGDWVKTLVACGAAGGISATFNAPIGGVFFALEVILGRVMIRGLGFVVISSVIADFVAHIFLGEQPSFIVPEYVMVNYWEILPYVLLGIICALAAVGFIRLFYKCEDMFTAWKIPEYLKPVFGGLIVGLIGVYFFDIFGVGYGVGYGVGGVFIDRGGVDKALAGEIGLGMLLILIPLKMIATSLTLGSGGSGGIFAPSLFIGSMVGGAFGMIAHRLFPAIIAPSGAYALVGMGAIFAAATRAPLTSIIMLFEMTRDYSLVLPLMTAVVISTIVARSLSRETIYTLKLVRRGIDIHQREKADILSGITAGEAMSRNFPTVSPATPIAQLMDQIHHTGHHGFPVVDEDGNFCGCVTLEDVETAMSKKNPSLTVDDIATKSPIVAYPDQSIHEALSQFRGGDVGRIPVVSRDNPKKLLGVLRRHDIIRAYVKATGSEPPRTNEDEPW